MVCGRETSLPAPSCYCHFAPSFLSPHSAVVVRVVRVCKVVSKVFILFLKKHIPFRGIGRRPIPRPYPHDLCSGPYLLFGLSTAGCHGMV